jgi:putative MFS transporter
MGWRVPDPSHRDGTKAEPDAFRIGRTQCVAAFLASLGLFADIGELALNIVFATSIPAMLGQAPAWAHSVPLGSVFAGGFVGAPLFGGP